MIDISQLGAHALAYLGDSVLECLIREALILKGIEKSSHLNKEALNYVTAVNQNKAYMNIENILTDEEKAVFKRGRNSSHLNVPKSASPIEYKNATGLEAVFGYLKLQKNEDRILELFSLSYPDLK
ncbi:MAG: ribonuclease III [Clostridia bacterium]|nr:ribonuclease III [Clostridia bacterium]